MLGVYALKSGGVVYSEPPPDQPLPENAIWFDLLNPTQDEERRVEQAVGADVPTLEEMQAIEVSSRLFHLDEALYMTATVIARSQTPRPDSTPVTFLLVHDKLVTVRYAELQPFKNVAIDIGRHPRSAGLTAESLLLAVLDAIVDREADLLESIAARVDEISEAVFQHQAKAGAAADFRDLLVGIGRANDLTSRVRESLVSLGRLFTFLAGTGNHRGEDFRARLETLHRDALALSDHASFLSNKLTFLLDATLGMLNIEQTNIIKIFSVAAVVLLPPTLIASIYGMNFRWMPELNWPWGYPLSLVLMFASALGAFLYFKWRRWL